MKVGQTKAKVSGDLLDEVYEAIESLAFSAIIEGDTSGRVLGRVQAAFEAVLGELRIEEVD